MSAWAIIATAVAVITIFIFFAYRRQVQKTCRQLAFLKNHQTNLRLTSDLPFHELNELVDGINDILDLSREIKKTAQQSEDSLKETITNLSHDIRTPLTSMDGYFQLLTQSQSEEERQHYIAVIQSRIVSLKDMLEELFTYTKLQNETYELEIEPLDFGKSVLTPFSPSMTNSSARGLNLRLISAMGTCLFSETPKQSAERSNIIKKCAGTRSKTDFIQSIGS